MYIVNIHFYRQSLICLTFFQFFLFSSVQHKTFVCFHYIITSLHNSVPKRIHHLNTIILVNLRRWTLLHRCTCSTKKKYSRIASWVLVMIRKSWTNISVDLEKYLPAYKECSVCIILSFSVILWLNPLPT